MKYMFMALATSLVVLFYCCATADILTTFTAMLIVFHCCGYTWGLVGNSQVSVYRTIGPTLVYCCATADILSNAS